MPRPRRGVNRQPRVLVVAPPAFRCCRISSVSLPALTATVLAAGLSGRHRRCAFAARGRRDGQCNASPSAQPTKAIGAQCLGLATLPSAQDATFELTGTPYHLRPRRTIIPRVWRLGWTCAGGSTTPLELTATTTACFGRFGGFGWVAIQS